MSEEVCLKVSVVVPDFNNVVESSTASNYRPAHLRSVVSKVFEEHVNNRTVDHLEKCKLFCNFFYGFRSSINCRLSELLGFLTGLGLLEQ